jgi:hypothetical protein
MARLFKEWSIKAKESYADRVGRQDDIKLSTYDTPGSRSSLTGRSGTSQSKGYYEIA